ncbi:MAG: flagellar motor switch protein FliM [Gemmatimonadetes bacterium]|nr:flagellar motor switch protein FliM [Gemmatimonadota bacterium]
MAETVDHAQVEEVLDTIEDSDAAAEPASGGMSFTAAAPAIPTGPTSYDFGHPDLLSREQARSMRTLHQGFAQALAKRLSTDLLSTVTATIGAVDHLTYAEFQMLLPTPTVLGVVDVPVLGGRIAVDLNPRIAFSFVDRILGGPGAPLEGNRALTAIELGLTNRIMQRTCEELGRMWKPIQEIEFSFLSIEANPELARVVNPDEMVVLITLELEMNETKGQMNLCLPYVVMEPAIHRLAQKNAAPALGEGEARHVEDALQDSLRRAPVTVDVDLGSVMISLRELLALQEGDVLRITPAAAKGALASIQGVPRMSGVPGISRNRRALRVESVHPPKPESGS